MRSASQAWDEIYQTEGRVFVEPFLRFPELVRAFRKHGCTELLDLGCGSGRHVVHLVREGFEVCGLDASSAGLHLTREWLVEEGVTARIVQADMKAPLPFRDGAFDGLLSTQVIHHARIAQVRSTIGEIWRVLEPGGLAFVTVSGRRDEGAFEEIEPGTMVPLTGPEAGVPHHIFSEQELRVEFRAFTLLEVSLRAEGKVLAVLAQKPMHR